ncbi:hypothetical protein [Chamaesiphon sp. OTE_20_metabat_361]|nr:hypothetical protein [Chamaesiphon sp. OTE_20_metabat_361]
MFGIKVDAFLVARSPSPADRNRLVTINKLDLPDRDDGNSGSIISKFT